MRDLRLPLLVLVICTVPLTGIAQPRKNIRRAVLAEVRNYPNLEIQDLYKLAYQAAMGNRHVLSDTAAARTYLTEEFSSLEPSSKEPLLEYLVSDSSVVRVNLRAWKAQHLNPEKLFQAMITTASLVPPSVRLLHRYRDDIAMLARKGKIPFKKPDIDKYFRDMERQHFPPVHHSDIYTKTFHPSYRIICRNSLSTMFQKERT